MPGLSRHGHFPLLRSITRSFSSDSSKDIFSDSGAADILVTVAKAGNLPQLQRLPEVSQSICSGIHTALIAELRSLLQVLECNLYSIRVAHRAAGRANVGKSTLLNALLGRRNLARTSQKPVNFACYAPLYDSVLTSCTGSNTDSQFLPRRPRTGETHLGGCSWLWHARPPAMGCALQSLRRNANRVSDSFRTCSVV